MALTLTWSSSIEDGTDLSQHLPMVSSLSNGSSRSRATSEAPSSFASCGSFDFDAFDSSVACTSQGSLKIKNTFIHVDRESADSDDEFPIPCKCVSAPNIETSAITPKSALKSKREAPPAATATPKADTTRTPKVKFDLCPSFFGISAEESRAVSDAGRFGSDGPLQVAEVETSGPYTVKNTFIHLDRSQADDSDDCDLPTRSSSLPALIGDFSPCRAVKASKEDPAYIVGSQIAAPLHLPAGSNLPLGLKLTIPPGRDSWPSPPSDGASSRTSSRSSSFRVKNTFIHVDADIDLETEEDEGLMMPMRSISQPQLTREESNTVAAEEDRPSLPSVGAALHSSGQCKPCAWFWKPESCKWGRECGHCHLCPVGELRRRKKEKQAETKELKAMLRQQQAS